MIPPHVREPDYEGELAVVIGRRCARRRRSQTRSTCVAGLTIAHDVSARDHQFVTGQFSWSKSFDTFCPLGPEVVSARRGRPRARAHAGDARERRGHAVVDTADLVFSVPQLDRVDHAGLRRSSPATSSSPARPSGVGAARDAAALPARRRRRGDHDRGARHAAQPGRAQPGRAQLGVGSAHDGPLERTVRRPDAPELRRPALVAAFEGWNDAGDAATDAVRWLARTLRRDAVRDARPRGVLRLPGGAPTVELSTACPRDRQVARLDVLGRLGRRAAAATSCCCVGVEPNLQVATFCDDVVSRRAHDRLRDRRDARRAARRHAALPTDARAPARRPTTSCSARLGMQRSRYEGPTGIVGVLHDAFAQRRLRVGVDLGAGARTTSRRRRTRRRRARCSTKLSALLDLQLDLTDLDIAASGVGAVGRRGRRRRRRRQHRTSSGSRARYDETTTSRRRPTDRRRRLRRRRRRLVRRGRPAVGRLARRRLRALPPRPGRRIADETAARQPGASLSSLM